jgi:Sulfotransferase family
MNCELEMEMTTSASDVPPMPSRLSVFPAPALDATQFPVFILGAARSGTSAVAQALLKCGEYQGFEEGHFLWLLRRFLDTIHGFYAFNGEDALPDRFTMLSYVPYTYMTAAVRAAFIAAIAEMFPTGRWVDKTPRPEMIEAARLMQELWPNSRFIFMKRRGIENVSSRLVKFPQLSFGDHCLDWANSMAMWLTVRDLLDSATIEVEQLAVARDPARIAREIGHFLEMPAHAIDELGRSLGNDLPERTSDIHAPMMDISNVGWSVEQITEFRKTCGAMMAAYGYSYTAGYFSTAMKSITV